MGLKYPLDYTNCKIPKALVLHTGHFYHDNYPNRDTCLGSRSTHKKMGACLTSYYLHNYCLGNVYSHYYRNNESPYGKLVKNQKE